VAISSTSPNEREEKWRSILNHIVDIHVHEGNKIFKKCTHETVERDWLKLGMIIYFLLKPLSKYESITIKL
jgi:hypothetical protein